MTDDHMQVLLRIEAKLDTLLAALAEVNEPQGNGPDPQPLEPSDPK